jgi:hypothetical protein
MKRQTTLSRRASFALCGGTRQTAIEFRGAARLVFLAPALLGIAHHRGFVMLVIVLHSTSLTLDLEALPQVRFASLILLHIVFHESPCPVDRLAARGMSAVSDQICVTERRHNRTNPFGFVNQFIPRNNLNFHCFPFCAFPDGKSFQTLPFTLTVTGLFNSRQ